MQTERDTLRKALLRLRLAGGWGLWRSVSATSGFVWFFVGDIGAKASTFIVLSQVSRWFGPREAEAFVLAQTAVMLFLAAGDLGFRVLGTRQVALAETPAQIVAIARSIQRRRLASALLVGTPVALVAAASLAEDWSTRLILAYFTLCWLPYFLGYDWVLLALRDFRRVTLARVSQVGVVLVALVAATRLELGAWCLGAGYALGFLAQWWMSLRGLPPLQATSEPKTVPSWVSLRSSLTMAVALAGTALFHSQEVLLTGRFLGSTVAAEFGAGLRLILTACSLGWIATQYLSPAIAKREGATRARQLSYLFPLAIWGAVASIGTWLLSDVVSRLVYADAIRGVASTLRWLAPILVLDVVVSLFGVVLAMQGRGREAVISTFLGVFGSTATFQLSGALGELQGVMLPIGAKYVGYVVMLLAQIHFAFVRAPAGTVSVARIEAS
jgi:O-antigen/teichoic acid export membrane protein